MIQRQPKYSPDEHARRGAEIYERVLRSQLESKEHGRIVAIDVDTEEFEVDDNSLSASERLLSRLPEAQVWCVRIGFPAVHRFGPRMRKVQA